jgi:hypothetical protein
MALLVRNSVPKPRVIPPFGTFELFVELRENAGGSGANYAIKWEAEKPDTLVSPPTIEALHSRFQAGYSVAFISRSGSPRRLRTTASRSWRRRRSGCH